MCDYYNARTSEWSLKEGELVSRGLGVRSRREESVLSVSLRARTRMARARNHRERSPDAA